MCSPDLKILIKVDNAATPEEKTWQYLAYSRSARFLQSISLVGLPHLA